ncbi:MAG: hypothetical protein HPY52_05560 [Firmicutes bacterium]|nr:hypothetical protein [Bacillota bacterium]
MKTILTLCPALGGPNDAHPDGIDSVLLPDPSRRGFNAGMPGEVPNAANAPKGCRLHPRCPHVLEICRSVAPPLKNAVEGHLVACHIAI